MSQKQYFKHFNQFYEYVNILEVYYYVRHP